MRSRARSSMLMLMALPPLKGPASGQENWIGVWFAIGCAETLFVTLRSRVENCGGVAVGYVRSVPDHECDGHDVTALTRRACADGRVAAYGRSPLRGRRSRHPKHPRVHRAPGRRPGRRTGSGTRGSAPWPFPGRRDARRRTGRDHPYDTADRRGRGFRMAVRANASLVSHLREIKQWWSTEPGGPGMKAEGWAGPVDTPRATEILPKLGSSVAREGERAQALGQLLHSGPTVATTPKMASRRRRRRAVTVAGPPIVTRSTTRAPCQPLVIFGLFTWHLLVCAGLVVPERRAARWLLRSDCLLVSARLRLTRRPCQPGGRN